MVAEKGVELRQVRGEFNATADVPAGDVELLQLVDVLRQVGRAQVSQKELGRSEGKGGGGGRGGGQPSSPLTLPHRSSLIAHRSSLIAHRSSLTAHRSPLTAHRSPLTAHRSPLTRKLSLNLSLTFW